MFALGGRLLNDRMVGGSGANHVAAGDLNPAEQAWSGTNLTTCLGNSLKLAL